MPTYTVWPTAAVGTAVQEVLVKEDVSDILNDLFPLDRPLQRILGRRPMHNVFCEEPVDTHANITRTSAVLAASAGAATSLPKPEGNVYTAYEPQYPGRIKSVAEIQGLQFAVSDTDRAMSQYGMADRFAMEALKTAEDVSNNFELSFWWAPGTPPAGADFDSGGGTVVARQTQGLMYWIAKTGLERSINGTGANSFLDGHGNEFGDGGVTAVQALNRNMSWCYNANGMVLDQTMLKEQCLSPWWDLTGRTGGAMGFAGARVKSLVSQFALTANGPINERTLEAASKKVVDAVDYYDTDFGTVSITLTRYLSISGQSSSVSQSAGGPVSIPWNEAIVFIQPQYFEIGVVRGVYFSPLGKTGDLEQGLIRGEQALVCKTPLGGAAIVNCVP